MKILKSNFFQHWDNVTSWKKALIFKMSHQKTVANKNIQIKIRLVGFRGYLQGS